MTSQARNQNHGQPADDIHRKAPHPERRLRSVQLLPCRDHQGPDYAGHVVLELASEPSGNTTAVCLEAADVVMLRAAATPESLDLVGIRDKAIAALGPAAATYVLEGHLSGYRLGVDDMENTPAYRTAPVDAGQVISFLEGRDSGVLPSSVHRAISAVLEILRDEEPA